MCWKNNLSSVISWKEKTSLFETGLVTNSPSNFPPCWHNLITSMRKLTMSGLLLSTACMRGLWPLLISCKEKMGRKLKYVKKKKMYVNVKIMMPGYYQQQLTIALMSAPASRSFSAKFWWPCSTAKWRGVKPENSKKNPQFVWMLQTNI